MIAKITLLTCLSLSIFYPFCFLLNVNEPLKQKFHHFHIGMPIVTGGVLAFFIGNADYSTVSKLLFFTWYISLFLVGIFNWKKDYLDARLTFTANVIGLLAFASIISEVVGGGFLKFIISTISALIYCASLYAMNLGHWYLNVHGLPIKHLRNAAHSLWVVLAIRLIWDICFILSAKVLYLDENIRLLDFMLQMDGFLLWVAVFFGTIFPIIALFFVNEILKLKNTQATTGILYVLLSAILLGDIAYKYYLIKYGIVL